MGISPSKKLSNSSEFNSACESVFEKCLDLNQHAFPGVPPYQLSTATTLLHSSLHHISVIKRWVQSPPSRSQIDSAFRHVIRSHGGGGEEEERILGRNEFKGFAVRLFGEAAVSNARNDVMRRIPMGVGGIVGVGLATRLKMDFVGAAVVVYAVGVATDVYLSLSSG